MESCTHYNRVKLLQLKCLWVGFRGFILCVQFGSSRVTCLARGTVASFVRGENERPGMCSRSRSPSKSHAVRNVFLALMPIYLITWVCVERICYQWAPFSRSVGSSQVDKVSHILPLCDRVGDVYARTALFLPAFQAIACLVSSGSSGRKLR